MPHKWYGFFVHRMFMCVEWHLDSELPCFSLSRFLKPKKVHTSSQIISRYVIRFFLVDSYCLRVGLFLLTLFTCLLGHIVLIPAHDVSTGTRNFSASVLRPFHTRSVRQSVLRELQLRILLTCRSASVSDLHVV